MNSRFSIRRTRTPCPKRPVSFLQSGGLAKPSSCAMEFYEAVVGQLTLPAMSGQSGRSPDTSRPDDHSPTHCQQSIALL
jgi:hypothetical protein